MAAPLRCAQICTELHTLALLDEDARKEGILATKDRPTTPTITMKFTDARAHLSEIFNQVAKEETRVSVEKNGVPVGAIVSARDLRRFQAIEEEARARALAAFAAFGEAFQDIPDDEFERELANAQAEAREKLQAERDRAGQE